MVWPAARPLNIGAPLMALPYSVSLVARYYPNIPAGYVSERLRYSTFVSTKHRYMYYEVPKAGCTSMKTRIRILEGLPEPVPFVGSHREVRREMFIHERSQFRLPSLLDFDDATQEEI